MPPTLLPTGYTRRVTPPPSKRNTAQTSHQPPGTWVLSVGKNLYFMGAPTHIAGRCGRPCSSALPGYTTIETKNT